MRKLELHHYILIGMALGAGIGLPLNVLGERGQIDPETQQLVAHLGHELGVLFLRLLQMVVVPLIVSSLVTGVTGMGSMERLGKLGGRTFGYYVGTSMLAITTGIVMVNLIRPGEGAALLADDLGDAAPTVAAGDESLAAILWDQVLHMVPKNPLAAAADGDMLPIIFFSLLLGVFINVTGGEAGELLRKGFSAGFEVMMRMTMFVVKLAPLGVFGFMLFAATDKGLSVFASLGWYMLTVFLALAVHALVTLPILLRVFAGRSALEFAKSMSPALITAFSTASSNATLPLTMNSIEQRAGVDQKTSAFVLPLGATINMDGTALYEAVAVLFIAQALGSDLDLAQQIVVAFTALLASVGAAGIPHAGTVMMVVVLSAVGLPTEAVGLILAVDRVLDMCRTTVNVWSDSTCAAVIDRVEHDLPPVDATVPAGPAG
ncbi:MAG: dicarboxylate/amino acid:cation symporter [Myxococcales bacterium]|jgi:Na+/H+-dicarboxylate symporter